MNADTRYPDHESVLAMIADRATGDLDAHGLQLLDHSLASDPQLEDLAIELELAATAASLAWILEEEDELGADCGPIACTPRQSPTRRPITPWVLLAATGWSVAAMLLLTFVVSITRSMDEPAPLSAQRDTLVSRSSDAVTIAWNDWESEGAPPEITDVQGDIVWSDAEQHGFMRFVGLPVNDPSVCQYQLWIIDAQRGMSQRINGGVFDCPNPGELIVEIDTPDIPVSKAAAFALTIEQPGGVWVSDMTRRVVIASR